MILPIQIQSIIQILGFTLEEHVGQEAGLTDFEHRTVSIRQGMTQAEVASTLAHECFHVMFGAALDVDVDFEEELIEHLASRWLLPLERLQAVPVDCHTVDAACNELGVDPNLFIARVRNLRASESDVLTCTPLPALAHEVHA